MSAFLFVPLLAFAWILGFSVAALASQYFLTVVESSATAMARNLSRKGESFSRWIRDGVQWPKELFTDYIAKMFYLAYIIGIWAGPAILLGRWLAGHSVWTTVIAGAAFWLFFPIGLLSSLASESRWTPFWSGIPVAFAARPAKTLGFYALSAPVLAVLFLTFDLILLHTDAVAIGWSIALCPAAVLLFFVYARLVGRLGLIVTFTRPTIEKSARPRSRKRKRPIHAYDMRTRVFGPKEAIPDLPAQNSQPSDLPPIETPFDGPVTGYAVDYLGTAPPIEEPKPAPQIMHFDDDDDTPITVAPPPDISGTDREKVAAKLAKPAEHEVAFHLRERPAEPTNPYGLETVSFLFDPKTIDRWMRLSLGLILMAIVQRGLDLLRPQ